MPIAAIKLEKEFSGSILDMGGGGEGVIGRVYRDQVTAIDNRQEELDEAPDGPAVKLLMDATALTFPDCAFQHVTAFFSFMYMPHETQARAVSEAARVLRPSGSLHIWDADILTAFPEPALVELEIDAAGDMVHTTYGVIDPDAGQNSAHFTALCQTAGLHLADRRDWDGVFYLRFVK